jgi:hypothetical protein
MSEQTVTSTTTKADRSTNYISSRLSYDCLMASTKSFVNSFNSLTQEEKQEFKSLNTYVKQLEKCMTTLRTNIPSKGGPVKRVPKAQPVVQTGTQAPVTQESVAQVAKGKKKATTVTKETSPTADAVNEVHAEAQVQPVPAKRGKKATDQKQQAVVEQPVQTQTETPQKKVASVATQNQKKVVQKKA